MPNPIMTNFERLLSTLAGIGSGNPVPAPTVASNTPGSIPMPQPVEQAAPQPGPIQQIQAIPMQAPTDVLQNPQPVYSPAPQAIPAPAPAPVTPGGVPETARQPSGLGGSGGTQPIQTPTAPMNNNQLQPVSPMSNIAEGSSMGQTGQTSQIAQATPEQGMWNTIMQNLTGHDAQGNMLQGDALTNFQQGHTLGAFLGALGAGIGGDSTGGRLGQAVYQQGAGGLAANNAERMQANQNDYMNAALHALAGGSQNGQGETAPVGPITQPSRTPYQSQTDQPTGGTNTSQGGQSAVASLDESLARMRRLSSIG